MPPIYKPGQIMYIMSPVHHIPIITNPQPTYMIHLNPNAFSYVHYKYKLYYLILL
jgi:hypothetical protein